MEKVISIDNYNVYIDNPLDLLMEIRNQTDKLRDIHISGGDISVTCPHHSSGHERRNSCYVNLTSEAAPYLWAHCFTCGFSAPFDRFIAECLDCSVKAADEWLLARCEHDYVGSTNAIHLESINLHKHESSEETYLDESILDTFESYHPYMSQRKLTDEVIEKFQIKYDKNTECIVMPVFDENNRLVALTRRSVNGKKFIIDRNFNKEHLFGINHLDYTQPVYLVESQLNCLTLFGYGKQSLALFGCGCTKDQIAKLNSLPIKQYIVAFDNDKAGIEGTIKLCNYLKRDKFVDVILFNDKRDVNDLPRSEFDALTTIDRFDYLNKIIK